MGDIVLLLFDPSGRIDRGEFWKGHGLLVAAVLALLALLFASADTTYELLLSFFIFPALVVLVWPAWALWIKRMRDLALSPWVLLLTLIPVFGAVVGLFLIFDCGMIKGVDRPKKYAGAWRGSNRPG